MHATVFQASNPISEIQASAPGQFVALTDGLVHYELGGPPDRPTVVLIHGFFPHAYVWDATFNALVQAGLRVLRYDLYGRGYSDRPDTRYDTVLFDRQLVELLSALEIDQPVDLVGASMGGAITLIFTDRHPTRVRRLGLIDPSGLYPKHAQMAKLMRIPLVGELLIALYCQPHKFPEPLRPFVAHDGSRRAFLSTIRHGPFGDISDVYQRVGQQTRPTLLIWGREDETIPFEISQSVRRHLPTTHFHTIENAGHKPYYEQPETVNPLLIEFLK
ncbi:MAG TPA: alpha/beta hydrolase [Chloroflexi bacterium]|nr:alpha/beta hydrolase [Chloroflexota bacterium]